MLQSVRNEVGNVKGFIAGGLSKVAANWYAIVTSPRHEKKVASSLERREIENFLPLYRTAHQWKNGCKAQLELPLFPGYMFVRLHWKNRVKVLDVPGVVTFVGTRTGPAELTNREIESIRTGLHLQKVEPFYELAVGQQVRIKAGPLAGLCGVMIRNPNRIRVVLTVEMIHKSVAVELDACDVEPIHRSKLHS